MKAGSLVAQRLLDEHEAGQFIDRGDLPGGGDAQNEFGARRGELLGDQDGERCADSHSDHPELDAVEVHGPHLGVVARPPRMSPAAAAGGEVADDVAIRIEQAHRGHRDLCDAALPPGLTQQIGGLEYRWRRVVLGGQQWGGDIRGIHRRITALLRRDRDGRVGRAPFDSHRRGRAR